MEGSLEDVRPHVLPCYLHGSLPARIQARLARFYGIEDAPAVDDFIAPADAPREALLVREGGPGGDLELSLHLPRSVLEEGRRLTFDELCQVIEGVSHFLYLVERARRELPATELELELQAEIDKYLLIAIGPRRYEPRRAEEVRRTLFHRVAYLHPAGTERGDRYRMANDLASRFARRLEATFARHGRFEQMRAALRRFYGVGQTEKIELARAA